MWVSPSKTFAIALIDEMLENAFVSLRHRHHKPVAGHRFSLGCYPMTESCAAWRLPAGRGRAGLTNTTRWRCCGSVLLCIRKNFSGVRGFIDFCPFFQYNHFLKSVSLQLFDFNNVTGASLRCPGSGMLYG